MIKNTLFALAATVALVSCTTEPRLDQRIQGSWQVTDYNLNGTYNSPFGQLWYAIHDSVIRPETYMEFGESNASYMYNIAGRYVTDFDFRGVEIRDSLTSGAWTAIDGQGINIDSLYIDRGGWTDKYEILYFNGNSMRIRTQKLVFVPTLGYLVAIEELEIQKQ